jgi:hypothetical protein
MEQQSNHLPTAVTGVGPLRVRALPDCRRWPVACLPGWISRETLMNAKRFGVAAAMPVVMESIHFLGVLRGE